MENKLYNIDYLGDLLVNDFLCISNIIYSSSIYMAEMYDELLIFTFYRAFVMGYAIMLFNI